VVKQFFTKRFKKPLFYNLLAGCAAFVILIIPVFAHASTLSFITSLLGGSPLITSANTVKLNSQTMPILSAAVNLDPHAAVGGGNIVMVNGSALEPDQGPSGTSADVTTSRYEMAIHCRALQPCLM
jgi:hypothetical protein